MLPQEAAGRHRHVRVQFSLGIASVGISRRPSENQRNFKVCWRALSLGKLVSRLEAVRASASGKGFVSARCCSQKPAGRGKSKCLEEPIKPSQDL